MKHNKISYENLEEFQVLKKDSTCLDKLEIKMNSCLGFLWLLITCYWYNSLINYLKKKI